MKPTLTPKDFFLYLAMFAFLYVSTFSFLQFIFSIINYTFPDTQYDYYDPYASSIRWTLSILIVLFPTYIFLAKRDKAELLVHPEKRELGIRKWLVYLTLFFTGITILIDLISVINVFLSGEISTRFILKVVSVLVVAGIIFTYYLNDLKNTAASTSWYYKHLAFIVSLLMLASVIVGFVIIGSPYTQRQLREDATRVSNLQSLQDSVINYWQIKKSLPNALSDLSDSTFVGPSVVDPVTKEAYGYQKISENQFLLCATFALPTSDKEIQSTIYFYEMGQDENWRHDAGKVCFDRTIDPDRYPPTTSPKPIFQ